MMIKKKIMPKSLGGKGVRKVNTYKPQKSRKINVVVIEVKNELEKELGIMLHQHGFDKSCNNTIRNAVYKMYQFNNNYIEGDENSNNSIFSETKSIYIKDNKSDCYMDGIVTFRKVVNKKNNMVFYEVLFMSIHKQNKRKGLATIIVDELIKKLNKEEFEKKYLCVSVKSNSNEAINFWESKDLEYIDENKTNEDEKTVRELMMEFNDFTPYGTFIN